MKENKNKNWDEHWKSLDKSLFGKFCSLYRKQIIANAVAHYLDKYFPHEGTFVECGSGTSQTTCKLKKRKRKLVALDLSKAALKEAEKIKQIDKCVQGDIFKLPFKDSSVDGIWNLGVMEHFTKEEILKALKEFARVLKKDSYAVLFWPPKFGPVNIAVSTIEFVGKIFRKKIDLFPDEINQFSSKLNIKKLASESGFSKVKVAHSVRDIFTHAIVILKK